MPEFTIYYGDGTTRSGNRKNQWTAAPNTGVQAVVDWTPPPFDQRRWAHEIAPGQWRSVEDRQVWTGDSTYNPFGYGLKTGTLLPDPEYRAIAARAFAEPRP